MNLSDGGLGASGYNHSPESKIKLSLSKLGDKNPNYGNPRNVNNVSPSAETRDKIRKSLLKTYSENPEIINIIKEKKKDRKFVYNPITKQSFCLNKNKLKEFIENGFILGRNPDHIKGMLKVPGMLGKKQTEEWKNQKRINFSGPNNHNYGKPRSEETKLKISQTLKEKQK